MNDYFAAELGYRWSGPPQEMARETLRLLLGECVAPDEEEAVAEHDTTTLDGHDEATATTTPGATAAAMSSEPASGFNCTTNTVLSSTTASSQSGHAETSIYGALNSFMQSVNAVEILPLTNHDSRRQRLRLLNVTANGLPPAAANLLQALQRLNGVLTTVLADDTIIPARQPPKAARLECHKYLHQCNTSIKTGREELETALDAMNEVEDPDDTSELTVFDACRELYTQIVVPRIELADAVLACRAAMQVRTAEVVGFAHLKMCEIHGNPALQQQMAVELLPAVKRFLDAVAAMQRAFEIAPSMQHDASVQPELLKLGEEMERLGVRDGIAWIHDYLLPKYGGRANRQFSPGKSQHHQQPGAAGSESALSDFCEAESLLDRMDDYREDLNGLYDAIGRVNLWLRRHGLTREVTVDPATGKAVPSLASAQQVFLPHDTRDGLWTRAMSDRYETACVQYNTLKEREDVAAELVEVSTLPDDQFILLCHDDMLAGVLRKADDACFMGDARAKVEKRLTSLVMRIKVFYHTNEVRVVTLPQRATLKELQTALQSWMPDIAQCRLFFFDEADRVVLDSEQEFADLVRSTRGAAISAGPMSSLGMSQSLSASATFRVSSKVPGCEIKLELYVEAPKLKGAVVSSSPPGLATRGLPVEVPSSAVITAASAAAPRGSEASRILERRAKAAREFAGAGAGHVPIPSTVPPSPPPPPPAQQQPSPPRATYSGVDAYSRPYAGVAEPSSLGNSSTMRRSTSALNSLRPQFAAPPPPVVVPPHTRPSQQHQQQPPATTAPVVDHSRSLPRELRMAAAPSDPEPTAPRFHFVPVTSTATTAPEPVRVVPAPVVVAPTTHGGRWDSVEQWAIPSSLSAFGELAQHTVVGDDLDEERLNAGEHPAPVRYPMPSSDSKQAAAPVVSRAAQLRRLRSGGRM